MSKVRSSDISNDDNRWLISNCGWPFLYTYLKTALHFSLQMPIVLLCNIQITLEFSLQGQEIIIIMHNYDFCLPNVLSGHVHYHYNMSCLHNSQGVFRKFS